MVLFEDVLVDRIITEIKFLQAQNERLRDQNAQLQKELTYYKKVSRAEAQPTC